MEGISERKKTEEKGGRKKDDRRDKTINRAKFDVSTPRSFGGNKSDRQTQKQTYLRFVY